MHINIEIYITNMRTYVSLTFMNSNWSVCININCPLHCIFPNTDDFTQKFAKICKNTKSWWSWLILIMGFWSWHILSECAQTKKNILLNRNECWFRKRAVFQISMLFYIWDFLLIRHIDVHWVENFFQNMISVAKFYASVNAVVRKIQKIHWKLVLFSLYSLCRVKIPKTLIISVHILFNTGYP